MSQDGGGPRRVRGGQARPARVRVTNPRMGTAARPPHRSTTREIDEQTGLGEVYMRSLRRAQLRQGLTVIVVVALALISLPLVFLVEPRLAGLRVLTVPLPWLIIGVGVYPVLIAAAWWSDRAAARNERDFVELVSSE